MAREGRVRAEDTEGFNEQELGTKQRCQGIQQVCSRDFARRRQPRCRAGLTAHDPTDMGRRMRHWAQVMTIVLVTSACTDEGTPAPTPTSAASVPGPVAEAGGREREGIEPAPHPAGDDGIGLFTKRPVIPPSPPREGGLFGLTREMIETARRTEGEPMHS
jgi:hypothetical protein